MISSKGVELKRFAVRDIMIFPKEFELMRIAPRFVMFSQSRHEVVRFAPKLGKVYPLCIGQSATKDSTRPGPESTCDVCPAHFPIVLTIEACEIKSPEGEGLGQQRKNRGMLEGGPAPASTAAEGECSKGAIPRLGKRTSPWLALATPGSLP